MREAGGDELRCWPGFLALVVVLYFAFNLLFAVAFVAVRRDALLGPGVEMLGGRFARAFFFSVQTFATIGYGQIGPNGFAANAIVTIEALIGLMFQALATGLLFARFARPRASIVFSRPRWSRPTTAARAEFRIANRRRNEIIQLEAQVLFSAMQPDGRGGRVRRYTALPLERNKVVFFPLSWTIVHPIDDASPLSGKTPADLERPRPKSSCCCPDRRDVRADGARPIVVPARRDRLEREIPIRFSFRARQPAGQGRHQSAG